MTSLAEALSGGAPAIRWADHKPGDIVTGKITAVDVKQADKFRTATQRDNNVPAEPDFWDDGKPKMQCIITIQTDEREASIDGDDGARAVYVQLWSGQKRALVDAMRTAGVTEPKVGQTFSAKWISGAGIAGDPRVFAYKLEGSAVADAFAAATDEAAPPF